MHLKKKLSQIRVANFIDLSNEIINLGSKFSKAENTKFPQIFRSRNGKKLLA
jgi:hypothetical protein